MLTLFFIYFLYILITVTAWADYSLSTIRIFDILAILDTTMSMVNQSLPHVHIADFGNGLQFFISTCFGLACVGG